MGKAKKIKVSKKDVVKSSGPLGDQILQGEFAVPTGSILKLYKDLSSFSEFFPSRIRIEELFNPKHFF
jgi:hypothetical protein